MASGPVCDYGMCVCVCTLLVPKLAMCFQVRGHQTVAISRPLRLADSDELTASHEEDPRVKYSKKRKYAELLGLCKKAIEWIHEREEEEEAFRSVLLEWQPDVENDGGRRILNPAVVRGRGRPAGAVGEVKRRAGVPPLPKRAESVLGSQTSNVSGGSRRTVKCGVCGGGHRRNSSKCPMFGKQVAAGGEVDEGEEGIGARIT